MSLLVERDYYETIECNFLLVGHTHSSIDQYFSVIAAAMRRAEHILSPIALMEHVVKRAFTKEGKHKNPAVVEQITVVYDMKTALAPFINTDIKFYSIPHRFLFSKPRGIGRAIMQYQIYTPVLGDNWLPKLPVVIDDSIRHDGEIVPTHFGLIGGRQSLMEHPSISKSKNTDCDDTGCDDAFSRAKAAHPVIRACEDVGIDIVAAIVSRFKEPVFEDMSLIEKKALIGNIMTAGNSATSGVIIWLKLDSSNIDAFLNLAPHPLNYYENGEFNAFLARRNMPENDYCRHIIQTTVKSSFALQHDPNLDIDVLPEPEMVESRDVVSLLQMTAKEREALRLTAAESEKHRKKKSHIAPAAAMVSCARKVLRELQKGRFCLSGDNGMLQCTIIS
jgi:hypothetical protein